MMATPFHKGAGRAALDFPTLLSASGRARRARQSRGFYKGALSPPRPTATLRCVPLLREGAGRGDLTKPLHWAELKLCRACPQAGLRVPRASPSPLAPSHSHLPSLFWGPGTRFPSN